jgi:hypothetical protein
MTNDGGNQGNRPRGTWRDRPRATGARPHQNETEAERRQRPPVMFRSRAQLATTYAPGVLFTWEGAKGICRAVPIDRGEAQVSDATRLLVFDGIDFIIHWTAGLSFGNGLFIKAPKAN